MIRAALAIVLAALAALVCASRADVRYAELADNRILVFDNGNRFVLHLDVLWSLDDPKQLKDFKKWLKKQEAGDEGDLIAKLKKDSKTKRLPVGQVLVAQAAAGSGPGVELIAEGFDEPIALLPSGSDWAPSTGDAAKVDDYARRLGVEPAAALLAVSHSKPNTGAPAAWSDLVKRAATVKEGIEVVPDTAHAKAVMVLRSVDKLPTKGPSTAPAQNPANPDADKSEKKSKAATPGADGALVWGSAGTALGLALGATSVWLLARSGRFGAAAVPPQPGEAKKADPFDKVVRKLEDEVRMRQQKGASRQNAQDGVSMDVLFRYENFVAYQEESAKLQEKLGKSDAEVATLTRYKTYAEKADEFEKRAKGIVDENKSLKETISTLESGRDADAAKKSDLQGKLNKADIQIEDLTRRVADWDELLRGYDELLEKSARRISEIGISLKDQ